MEKAKDAMNRFTQRRHGFTVESLPISPRTCVGDLYSRPHGQLLHDTYEERLRDNTQTPVPEQVAFRLDWPAWLATITDRDRRLGTGHGAQPPHQGFAPKYGLSPARISQKRREFHDDWQRFCGELPVSTMASTVGVT